MYLTQLQLDPRSMQARRDLADPYDMHRTLVRAFVRDERDRPPRFLWRLEPGQAWSEPVLLLQSELAPDWGFLDGLQGYLQGGLQPRVKQFDPAALVQVGATCRFRLAANPTVTRDGKRFGLAGEQAQLDWLQRQGQRLGFDLLTALVTGRHTLKGRKGTAHISVLCVQYEGMLKVIDASALRTAVGAGIGPAKALGCGLLSLARSA